MVTSTCVEMLTNVRLVCADRRTDTVLSVADVRIDLVTQRADRSGHRLDLTAKDNRS